MIGGLGHLTINFPLYVGHLNTIFVQGVGNLTTKFQKAYAQWYIDTDISQHTPYQGFSVTGYIMNR
jgi:hypothetical protein